MSAVHIDQPQGSVSFPRATADMFEPDVLTVTWDDTGEEARVFQSGTWDTCTVYDERGNPLFLIISHAQQARAIAAALTVRDELTLKD